MPRGPADAIPQLHEHKPSGQARVVLDGHHVYLGRIDDPKVHERYDATIQAWLANGRRWPPPEADVRTLNDLAAKYIAWASAYYRKRDEPTKFVRTAERVAELLARSLIGNTPALGMTRSRLAEFQRYLLLWTRREPFSGQMVPHLSRRTINDYVAFVPRMYGHWESECEDSAAAAIRNVKTALEALKPLRKGRSPGPGLPVPRETDDVGPVALDVVDRTCAAASPVVRAMIRVQLLAAMRPAEVCGLRPCYLSPTPIDGVLAYHVPRDLNKLDHYEVARIVYLGPKALEALRPWLPDDPECTVFDPALADRAARGGTRSTTRARSGAPYTVAGYARAIARACDRAFPHPTLSDIPRRKRTPEQALELAAWQSDHRWSPNQLRHAGATEIAAREGLDIARRILGHQSIETTLIYTRRAHDQAALLATLKHG